jgi:hypothetical protein
MNINKPRRKNTLWHMEVQAREEAYAPVAADLSAFNQYKKTLLDRLHSAYERGPKSEPFDAEKSWLDLTVVAKLYLWGRVARHETMPPAERFNHLLQLANALGRAHRLAVRVMEEDIYGALFKAWFSETKIPLASASHIFKDGSSVATLVGDEIKNTVERLAALETAARSAAAANAIPTTAGRPPLLPSDCIHGLARVYRNSTGLKPGRGAGPFAEFVSDFITAVNCPDFEFGKDSVIDAIKNAHRRRKPSMFDV